MDEDDAQRLAAARLDIVQRLTALNAEHLKVEGRRAGLEIELEGARRDGAAADRVMDLHRQHQAAVARLAAIEAERETLELELETLVARGNAAGA